jgi:hypothetical protein
LFVCSYPEIVFERVRAVPVRCDPTDRLTEKNNQVLLLVRLSPPFPFRSFFVAVINPNGLRSGLFGFGAGSAD